MAKKKVKKKVAKKKVSKIKKQPLKVASKKKTVKRKIKKAPVKSKKFIYPKKVNLVIRNLIWSAVLALISFILYSISGKEMYQNFFWLAAVILLFVAIAFLIVLLILIFMKGFKKK